MKHNFYIALILFFFNFNLLAESINKVANEAPNLIANNAEPEIGVIEKIGTQLDLNLLVKNEEGNSVPLSSFFQAGKPVILTPIYFACAGLCNLQLNGLMQALKNLDWIVGEKFQVLAFSFDPNETEYASKKKLNYVNMYGRPESSDGWHFLTAEQSAIDALTTSIGFKYKRDEKTKEWLHASAAIIISPEGKISRYLHGINFDPRDIKLALMDSTDGKNGSIIEKISWYGSDYNSQKNKYQLATEKFIIFSGGIFALLIALIVLSFYLKRKQS